MGTKVVQTTGPTNHWLRIPCEIHEKIFALLPVNAVLVCRVVCRRWRSILTSPTFLHHWSAMAVPLPWFLFLNSRRLRAYNPFLATWQDLPCPPCHHPSSLVASSAGLVVLVSNSGGDGGATTVAAPPALLVCNPLTFSSKLLPPPQSVTLVYLMGMLAADVSGYKVIVAGAAADASLELLTEVYDSSTCRWQLHSSAHLDDFRDLFGMRGVCLEGRLYCLSVPPYKMVAYDTYGRRWISYDVPEAARGLSSGSLFICRGSLILAAKLVQGKRVKKVSMWEFDSQRESWRAVELAANAFSKCLSYFMSLQGSKGSDSICFNSWCRWRTLMYDVCQQAWHWMPQHAGDFKDVLSGLTYEPSFSARA